MHYTVTRRSRNLSHFVVDSQNAEIRSMLQRSVHGRRPQPKVGWVESFTRPTGAASAVGLVKTRPTLLDDPCENARSSARNPRNSNTRRFIGCRSCSQWHSLLAPALTIVGKPPKLGEEVIFA